MRHSRIQARVQARIQIAAAIIIGISPSLSYARSADSIKNWGLDNSEKCEISAQAICTPSHISALKAWSIEEGSKKVVVAVIDTGIDPNTSSLAPNLWHNPKAPSQYGWDFITNQANPIDENNHGTHIAGIIGATEDARTGVSGVAHHVSIMPIRYYSDKNSGTKNLANSIEAIDWAIKHGAKIINYSGGGPSFSKEEFTAIKKAEKNGILIVAAAGNEHQNTDSPEHYYFPSGYRLYGLTNIISVASTDIRNNILPSSNWGKTSVDVAAPGENIRSTLPRGRIGTMTGTSQATAFVSGIAALLLSKNPNLSPQEIREIIMKSVDVLPQLETKVASGGRVNAYKALLALGR